MAAVLMLLAACVMRAARIEMVEVPSQAMGRKVKVVYVLPDKASDGRRCPVVYLLHGHGGDELEWLRIKPDLPRLADELGFIFACPDGENSWYWDSPLHPQYRYETFTSHDLVAYTDSCYATQPRREARAVAGLSMGGHGAMWLSIRHKDTFGAAACMSGGVDIRPFPDNWHMKDQLGKLDENREVWDKHTVITQLDSLKNGDLAISIDCGESDFFLEVNKAFHRELLKRGIAHDFTTRPGAHNRTYWANSIDYQLLFFKKYFRRKGVL